MITHDDYKEMTGYYPVRDDLERANCKKAGDLGHFSCGICPECKKPRFVCGHIIQTKRAN